jgi:hypothetical protein
MSFHPLGPSHFLVPTDDRSQQVGAIFRFGGRFLFVSSIENFRKLMIPAEGIFAEDGMAHGYVIAVVLYF